MEPITSPDQLSRSDVDVFSYPGNIPLIGFKDLIDYLNWLVVYLGKIGLIKDINEFVREFNRMIETKGNLKGELRVVEYNFNEMD